MRAWLVLIALAGCVRDNLVACENGELCPVGTVCDVAHGGCVLPEQLDACAAVSDLEPCQAGAISGTCFDEVCLTPGCGNSVVEPGELCDDGNRERGDGCNESCTSREVCGDGAIDLVLGEQCDDGNRISRDGCDSQCGPETATWTVEGITPTRTSDWAMTYDTVRGRVLFFTSGVVWTWNGTRWSILSVDGPRLSAGARVVFDRARDRLVVISTYSPLSVWEWDATTWVQRTIMGTWPTSSFLPVYDSVRDRVLGFSRDPDAAWHLDLTAGRWTSISPPAAVPVDPRFDVAFDEARGRMLVIFGADAAPKVIIEWDGTSWTSVTRTMPVNVGWSLTYDPSLSAVISTGGSTSGTYESRVFKWALSGGSMQWIEVTPAMPTARFRPSTIYDRARARRITFGGSQSVHTPREDADVYELNGSAWTLVRPVPNPEGNAGLAFDQARDRLVRFNGRETDVWDGTWRQLLATSPTQLQTPVAFDPQRGGVVATGSLTETWLLGDTAWTQVALGGAFASTALAYDPSHARLTSVGFDTRVMSPGMESWTKVADAPSSIESCAFDARNGRMVAIAQSGATHELVGDQWLPSLSPGVAYHAVADARRGTVVFVGPNGSTWERRGPVFLEQARPPIGVYGPAAYDAKTGRLFVVGTTGTSFLMLTRTFTSSLARETCIAGEDADGDGLAECADPDCFVTCTPACPPYATCP